MTERLIVFEDAAARHFAPLAHTRPVFELLCGLMSPRERCERAFGAPAALVCRSYLAPLLAAASGRPVNSPGAGAGHLFLMNGRLLDPAAVIALAAATPGPGAWWNGDELVAARVPAGDAEGLFTNLAGNDFVLDPGMVARFKRHEAATELARSLWGLVLANAAAIERDAAGLDAGGGRLPPGVHALGSHPLLLAPGAEIEPGAVLDLRAGPIVIGPGARVAGLTRLEGPAGIGARTQILGGRIRAGTTIGPGCRIAGEVEASIVQGNSNKYHDGFLGHAYVGEWVNLGALTTNSDLKNTYGTVKVWQDGQLVDTGEQKVGAMIGDHVKTGIGSLLDTGTVIGVAANIFGGSTTLGTKFVPSFAWGTPPRLTLHDPMRALETMQEVMRRRGMTMTAVYREMLDQVFERTQHERAFAGIHEL
jgi:UDP-N-acetylglucosamine diphosphorylase/glucosamine-1-phosphate N-acetyltransferase